MLFLHAGGDQLFFRRPFLNGQRGLGGFAAQVLRSQNESSEKEHHAPWNPHDHASDSLVGNRIDAPQTGHRFIIRINDGVIEGQPHAERHVGWYDRQNKGDSTHIAKLFVNSRPGPGNVPPEQHAGDKKRQMFQVVQKFIAQSGIVHGRIMPAEEGDHPHQPDNSRRGDSAQDVAELAVAVQNMPQSMRPP